MNILKTGIVAVLALVAGATFAAVNLTFLTVDGGTNATVTEGSIVEAKVTHDITGSTDVESMSWELVGSGLPQTCVNTVDRIADGTFTVSFDMDTEGASEGTWDVRIRAYGDDGPDVSNLCETTDQVDSQLFTDRITVTDQVDDNQGNDNDSNNTGGNDDESVISFMQDWIKEWSCLTISKGTWTNNACVMPVVTPPAPAPLPVTPTACATLSMKMSGTVMNVYNPSNVILQGFLIGEGMSIPWLTNPAISAGVPFGFFGNQTSLALSTYKQMKGCV